MKPEELASISKKRLLVSMVKKTCTGLLIGVIILRTITLLSLDHLPWVNFRFVRSSKDIVADPSSFEASLASGRRSEWGQYFASDEFTDVEMSKASLVALASLPLS